MRIRNLVIAGSWGMKESIRRITGEVTDTIEKIEESIRRKTGKATDTIRKV